jgi:hypothetical protein
VPQIDPITFNRNSELTGNSKLNRHTPVDLFHQLANTHGKRGCLLVDTSDTPTTTPRACNNMTGTIPTMADKLERKGYGEAKIAAYVDYFVTTDDNRVLDIGAASSPRLRAFERLAEWSK